MMFRKSRKRIVLVIMTFLTLFLAGTLCVIYGSSYAKVYQRNQNMLAHHIALSSDGLPQDRLTDGIGPKDGVRPKDGPPDNEEDNLEDDIVFRLSTFYSVVMDETGSILRTDNIGSVYTDEELENIAKEVAGKRNNGTYGSLVYRCEIQNGVTTVALMDNTIMQESITTLFQYTLIFGSVMLLVVFFIARFFAKMIVKPLEENYQKQKQFISDAGHELKTPVSIVNANAEMLERQIGENQWLSNIQYENLRMGTLVTQLLELARTENVVPQMDKVDLSHMVTGEMLPFETVAYEQGISLESHIQDGIRVYGNATQLGQLTSILLDNAIRHCKHQGIVRLKLRTERNKIILLVSNEGEPIPAEQQKMIFERFYRADEARTGTENRYGLGLSIAKAIVQNHNGRIEVSCQNGWVEFCIILPFVNDL